MKIDERMREAIVSSLKAEARGLGLEGDAFWTHIWTGVESVCVKSGDLPKPMPRKAPA